MNIKSILVSQPEPKNNKNPFSDLANKFKLKVDFRSFIHVEGVESQEFRQNRINLEEFSAVIFTSRMAVDHYFRIASETRFAVPDDMKYFCISEQTANYLQKYIVVRKRKVFVGERTAQDILDVIKKHKNEKYLFPCSNIRKDDIPSFMNDNGYNFTEAIIYKTVAADLSDLDDVLYDVIAFFSPSGINSLFVNFPEFKQNKTRIAVFGPTTAKAAVDAGLILDIEAPLPNAPSMTGALELYIKKANGLK